MLRKKRNEVGWSCRLKKRGGLLDLGNRKKTHPKGRSKKEGRKSKEKNTRGLKKNKEEKRRKNEFW